MCEYILFVDKVKDPHVMTALWNSTTGVRNEYRNYTEVFVHDEGDGWVNIINGYNKLNGLYTKDRQLRASAPPDANMGYFYAKLYRLYS
jgi:hypothetical protein